MTRTRIEKISFVIIFLLVGGVSKAQIVGADIDRQTMSAAFGKNSNNLLEEANKNYDLYAYTEAIALYEKVLVEDRENNTVKLRIAESYRKLNMPAEAAAWYGKVVNTEVAAPIDKLYYAQALSSIGEYEVAKVWYQNYNNAVSGDDRAKDKIAGINEMANFYADSAMYEVAEVAINSEVADFSPSYYKEGLVFASERNTVKSRRNDRPYLDLYFSKIGETGALALPTRFNKKVNSKFNEGTVVFYEDGQKMIFTRNNINNNKIKKSQDGTIKLKIFFAASTSQNDWSNLTEFPYNSDEYSVGHPTLSTDGNTLYFVSDMPGGQGGTDIYMSTLNAGNWSKPANMGNSINTKGNEMFPFISKDKTLYFSSDGYAGLGGLDIYRVGIKGNDITSSVANLGYPVNTPMDDFGIIFDDTEKMGYFSSNRTTGKGDDDIYSLRINNVQVISYLKDKETGENLNIPSQDIVVVDKATRRKIPFIMDGNKIQFDAIPGKEYEIKNISETYTNSPFLVDTKGAKKDMEVDASFEKVPEVPVIALGEKIKMAKAVDLLLVENISGSSQQFLFGTDEFTSYKGTEDELNTSLSKQGVKVSSVIRITNIYYDLDKSAIRKDAAIQLEKIVKVMKSHQNITIALSSHTDSRQTNAYNDRLAKRRAVSAMNYLVKNGVKKNRISIDSFGETQLVNNCGDDKECAEDLHQLNRRTEFMIR